jgi:hypothetical protein
MSIDIVALDLLPETDPISVMDLADQGLQRCSIPCWWTCWATCNITEILK